MNSILNRPVAVLMLHLMIAAFAVFAFMRLPIELTPEVDFPRLSVVTHWGQSSSETMVRNITLPIEEAASTLMHVKNVSSTSREGESVVKIDLDKETDLNFTRLELLEKLSAIKKDLPNDVSFPLIQKYVSEDFSSLQGFISYNLFGDMSLSEIKKYAEENIKPALLGIKGVGAVKVSGASERQIYILLDRQKMQSIGITLSDVLEALKNSTNQQTVGQITESKKKYFILTGNKIYRTDELENITLIHQAGNSNQLSIRLGSIAQIVDSLSSSQSYVRINGKPSVSIEIERERGTNILSLANTVNDKISYIKKSFPASLSLSTIYDKSKEMRADISELFNKVIISVVVIFIIILLFFRNIFLSLIIVFSVGFSIAGGVIFLALSGIGLNLLTLAALALSLGIVIDNNVVVVENINRVLEEEGSISSIKNNIIPIISKSLGQIKLPLIAATLTTVGALVPVLFLPEDLKPYFIQFAETTAVVIVFSLLIAFALVPVLLLFLYRIHKVEIKANYLTRRLKQIYVRVIEMIILNKKTALVIAIWLFGLPVWLLPSNIDTSSDSVNSSVVIKKLSEIYNSTFGSDFYLIIKPYVNYSLGGASQLFFNHVSKGEMWNYGNETYLELSIYPSQGIPLIQINKYSKQIEDIILPYKNNIKLMTTSVSFDYGSVRLDFTDSTSNTRIPFIIKEKLMSIAARTGGLTVRVEGYGPGFFSGGEATPNMTVEILGYNYTKVKEIAEELSEKLKHNIRIDNIKYDRIPQESENHQVLAVINRTGLNQVGSDVSGFIQNISPNVSSDLSDKQVEINNDLVNTIVKFNGYQNTTIENLPQKEIILNKKTVRLAGLINLNTEPVMPVIERDNQQYSRYITFDYKGTYKNGDIFTDEVIKSINLPPGYELKRPQYSFNVEKEALPLLLMGFFSVLIVFMITASLYESYKKPFIIILSVPMSMIGLFSVFYFADANFGRGGYASILFLIGLAVNHGILMVDRVSHIDSLLKLDDKISRAKMIAEASSQRLRPILITTIVTVAGFLPFVISANVYSFWYPFSLGIIGGVTVSTILILFYLPALYELMIGRINKKSHS